MGNVAKLEQPKEPTLVLDRKTVLSAIPSNWCDELLTGRGNIPKGYTYTAPDIEKLLNGIRARLEKLPTLEPCDVCGNIVDSTADACSHCA